MSGPQGCLKLGFAQDVSLPIGTDQKCLKCGIIKPLSDFYIKKRRVGKAKPCKQCKNCQLKYKKEWFTKNKVKSLESKRRWRSKPGVKERQRKIYIEFYRKNKEHWIQILNERNLTHCSICGYNRSFCAIDFHHVNSGQKEFQIGSLIRHKPKERALKEIEKCIPICSNCHRELHEKLRKEDLDVRTNRTNKFSGKG